MGQQLIVGCDVDGVLADFNTAYRQRLIDVTGRELIPPFVNGHEPGMWYYATDEYGYTKEEDSAVWKSIIADPYFWGDLTNYPDTRRFIADLYMNVDPEMVYFITTRPGVKVKDQTEEWLRVRGVYNPTVLIAADAEAKGRLAVGLGLTHFIDDRPENCFSVLYHSPETKVYLLTHKYNLWAQRNTVAAYDEWINKHHPWTGGDPRSVADRFTLIHSLADFTQALTNGRNESAARV